MRPPASLAFCSVTMRVWPADRPIPSGLLVADWDGLSSKVLNSDGLSEEGLAWVGFYAAALCTALASHRIATVERITPGGLSAAQRASLRRSQQRGRPVYSYNVVKLRRPETALHRGCVVATESLKGTRRHLVIGHWRLIDGKAEPFWVWIDGHERGDRALGLIVKERHVQLSPVVRRGFTAPSHVGASHERVPARRLA